MRSTRCVLSIAMGVVLLLSSFGLRVCAQSRAAAATADVFLHVSPDSSATAITRTAGTPVQFTLSARRASGSTIADWEYSGDTAIVRLRNSIAENDTSTRSWNADTLGYTWVALTVKGNSGLLPLRTGPYEWRIPASAFFSGFLDVLLVSTLAEQGPWLEAAAVQGAGWKRSASLTLNPGSMTNYLVELTTQLPNGDMSLMRPFEAVVTMRDRYLNKTMTPRSTRLTARFPGEFTGRSIAQMSSPYTWGGTRSYIITPSVLRTAPLDEEQRVIAVAVNDSAVRGVSDGFRIVTHAPYPFSLTAPVNYFIDSITSPLQNFRFSWTRDAKPDPWTDIQVSRFNGDLDSDTLWSWVVFADSNCNAVDTIAAAGNGQLPWADISGAELLAVTQRAYGPVPGKSAFLYWYVETTDGISTTRSTIPPAMPASACGARMQVRDARGREGKFEPASFVLTPDQKRQNPSLFRIDHTGVVPGFPAALSKDSLRLHWQPSQWTDTTRNDPADPVRYEWNVIIDSIGQTSKTLTIPFPSNHNGLDPEISIGGDVLYRSVFRPDPWPKPIPDTLVMRVTWFVRAYNSIGFTYSDTAGATIRKNPIPTPPLVLSYNVPPDVAPSAVFPANNAVIKDLTASSPPLDIIWTPSRDRNIDAGLRMDCFKIFDMKSMSWIHDWSQREVDTNTYQWLGVVARTSPPGKGAPVGTSIVRNTGTVTGFQMTRGTFEYLFGGFDPGTSTSADTVVLDWKVFAKDFNTTENPTLRDVTFRYNPDGSLRSDTAMWSRYGEQPHEIWSNWFRLTLTKKRSSTAVEEVLLPSELSLAQNYPNPLSGSVPGTSISYALGSVSRVHVVISNSLGVALRKMDEGERAAGRHSLQWDGRDEAGRLLPSGLYFYTLRAGSAVQTRMLQVLR